MKKILLALAFVALFVGCTGNYDDSVVLEKIASLEKRIQTLEGNMAAIQSALEGKTVQKVEEYKNDDGVVVGVTVTYTDGDVKRFEISSASTSDGPVLCIIKNGAGELCWALDWGGETGKVILKDADGNDVPVHMVPTFEIGDDGHLYMTVDGEKTDLGMAVATPGSEPVQDGIVKAIEVTAEAVIITYDTDAEEDGVVSIPLVNAFKLVIETTSFEVSSTNPINIPYTITNKTAQTVVDAYYNPAAFGVAIDEAKIVVTPKAADAEGMILVYADSKTGLTSIVKLTFGPAAPEADVMEKNDTPSAEAAAANVDYLGEAAGGAISAHVLTNIAFEVAPQAAGQEWIHVGAPTKAPEVYTIPITLDENTSADPRTGNVVLYRAGTTETLQTIVIGQKGAAAGPGPEPAGNNLSANGTANCYIIYEAGEYTFDAVKGNSDEAVSGTAFVLWETQNGSDEIEVGSVIASAALADGKITIQTADPLVHGNAIISVKDAADSILWSWHIWLPKDEVTSSDQTAVIGGHMMNMNLGALETVPATGEAPVASIGLWYQWGRPTPFPAARAWDSYPSVIKTAGAEFTKELRGEKADPVVAKPTVASALAHPTLLYFTKDDDASWTDSDEALWSDTKTKYDPCPVGYKMPGYTGSIWTQSDEGWTLDLTNHVLEFGGIRFPSAGYTEAYGGSSYGSGGGKEHLYLWSGLTHDAARGKCVYIRTYNAEGSRYYKQKRGKANAASVRCVKE